MSTYKYSDDTRMHTRMINTQFKIMIVSGDQGMEINCYLQCFVSLKQNTEANMTSF